LPAHLTRRAETLARDKAGNNSAAKIAMIPMTTSNSINVNAAPDCRRLGQTRVIQATIRGGIGS
jgi:hypothetical protein